MYHGTLQVTQFTCAMDRQYTVTTKLQFQKVKSSGKIMTEK